MSKIEAVNSVEAKYLERIDALTPKERIARATSIFRWTREAIARRIVADLGPISSEKLKWLVAMRQYGADRTTEKMIQKVLENVAH
jgi:DNA-directed RNA polymerase subunit F